MGPAGKITLPHTGDYNTMSECGIVESKSTLSVEPHALRNMCPSEDFLSAANRNDVFTNEMLTAGRRNDVFTNEMVTAGRRNDLFTNEMLSDANGGSWIQKPKPASKP